MMSVCKTPYISVIIAVYNGENMIAECIESLLNQDYPKDRFEIIIVDNNSKDNTAEIIKKYPIEYVLENRIQSSYAARNAGIKYSRGKIIVFTDADCIASHDWLKKGAEEFKNDETGCVAGEIKGYKPANYIERYYFDKSELSQKSTLEHPFLPYPKTANAFYRREVFEKIGYFENEWLSSADADFAWRMQLETNYKIKYIPEAIVFHKHRSTLISMFKQYIKWGIGQTLLYKKYGNRMPERTFKQTIWIFLRLFYIFMQASGFCFYIDKEKMPENKRKEYLDHISFFGWELGRMIGSIRNKVFYV